MQVRFADVAISAHSPGNEVKLCLMVRHITPLSQSNRSPIIDHRGVLTR